MAVTQEEFAEYGSMLEEDTDFTLEANNRIILLTKAGYDKIENSGSGTTTYSGVKNGYYSLWYNNQGWGYITYSDFSTMVAGLKMTIPTDYSMEATEKKVIFTEAGAKKYVASIKD